DGAAREASQVGAGPSGRRCNRSAVEPQRLISATLTSSSEKQVGGGSGGGPTTPRSTEWTKWVAPSHAPSRSPRSTPARAATSWPPTANENETGAGGGSWPGSPGALICTSGGVAS